MRRAFGVGIALLCVGVFACGGEAPSPDKGVTSEVKEKEAPALDAFGNPPADYLATPGGFYHKSCVHWTPPGSRTDDNDNVYRDGSMIHYEPCKYPIIYPATPPAKSEIIKPGSVPYVGHAWIETASQVASTQQGFNYVQAVWTVPPVPVNGQNGQSLFMFPAVQPSTTNGLPLLQPVIEYGGSVLADGSCSVPSGTSWCMNAWYVTPGCNYYYGDQTVVNVGDPIYGKLIITENQPVVGKTWGIYVQDGEYPYPTSQRLYTTTSNFLLADTAVLEVWALNSCNGLPNSIVTDFSNIQLDVANGSCCWTTYTPIPYAPTLNQAGKNFTPQCGYDVSNTGTITGLWY